MTKLTTYLSALLLLTSPIPALSSGYVWLDFGNGNGQWVYVPNQEPQQKDLNEDWADQHLNDPDTGFNELDFN